MPRSFSLECGGTTDETDNGSTRGDDWSGDLA